MADEPKNTEWPEVWFCSICGKPYEFCLQHEEEPPELLKVVPLQTIRERLTSDEAVRALARERFDYLSGYAGTRWEEAHESIRRQEEGKSLLFLEAAFRAAFPDTKEQPKKNDERRVK